MRRSIARALLLLALGGSLAACSGGGGGGPDCEFDDPAVFDSTAAWPKFHRDLENSGRIPVDANAFAVLSSPVSGKQASVFPEGDAKGSFVASPVLSRDGSVAYIGSNDHTMYALRTSDWTQTDFNLVAADAFNGAALVVQRFGRDAIFAGSLDALIYGLDDTSVAQDGEWPFVGTLPIDTSLNLADDGTVYGGSASGIFYGVCPNGIVRFTLAIGDSTPAAIDPADNVYVGSSDRLLRVVRYDGVAQWSLTASQPIVAAPVLEVEGDSVKAVYFADLGGNLYKASGQGLIEDTFRFTAAAGIESTPALAGGTLYFGSDDGFVHAVSTATGMEKPGWPVATAGAVISSPAVAEYEGQRVIVVGSEDGSLYFLVDDGTNAPTVAAYPIGAPVRSSPAIDFAGNVYVGAEDGRVYAIKSSL